MNEEEKEAIRIKRQTILLDKIDKLQKELDKKNKLLNKVIKKVPIVKFDGTKVTEETLLEDLDTFFDEWERLEDKEDKLFELSSLNYIHKKKIREKIKELENQVAQFIEDRENKHTDKEIIYARDILEEILEENE